MDYCEDGGTPRLLAEASTAPTAPTPIRPPHADRVRASDCPGLPRVDPWEGCAVTDLRWLARVCASDPVRSRRLLPRAWLWRRTARLICARVQALLPRMPAP